MQLRKSIACSSRLMLAVVIIGIASGHAAEPQHADSAKELRQIVAAQQQELDAQRQMLEALQQQVQSLIAATAVSAPAPAVVQTSAAMPPETDPPKVAVINADRTDREPEEKVSRVIDQRSMPVTSTKAPVDPADFPGALRLPGKDIWWKIGGFAKVDYIQDLDPIGSQFDFETATIPVPQTGQGGQTTLSAMQSRLNVDVRYDTNVGLVRGFVEGDFFDSNNALRLRHAYGEWNGWLGGQTWSTLMDPSALPDTLDFEGPDSAIFVRQAQIRYTRKAREDFEWAVAVEDPDSQIFAPAGVAGEGRSDLPDVPGYVRFQRGRSHLQVGGILRQLRFTNTSGTLDETTLGYGLVVSGGAKLLRDDQIMGQIYYGKGMSRYIEAFDGNAPDAVLTPAGNLESLRVVGAVFGYTHAWNERWSSTLTLALAEIDNAPTQPDDAFKSTRSPHFNLIWSPNQRLSMGGEIMWGERENKNGESGDATRLQFSVTYK